MDQERRSQREMMQENEKQARTTYTNAQAKAAMPRRDNKASKLRVELTDPRKSNYWMRISENLSLCRDISWIVT